MVFIILNQLMPTMKNTQMIFIPNAGLKALRKVTVSAHLRGGVLQVRKWA